MGWFDWLQWWKPRPPKPPPPAQDRWISLNVYGPDAFTATLIPDLHPPITGQITQPAFHHHVGFWTPAAVGGGASVKADADGWVTYYERLTVGGKTVDELGGLPRVHTEADSFLMTARAPEVPPMAGRLTAAGRRFALDGARFRWRGITAFRLLELLHTGNQAEAMAFLDFCATHDLSPRVLTMAWHLFRLDPADGRAQLPTLLAEARKRQVCVEVVALADTKAYAFDFDAHVSVCGAMCEAAGNAWLEVGNEVFPIHSTQSDRLTPDYLQRLARRVPVSVPVSLGSTHGGMEEDRTLPLLASQLPNGCWTAHDTRTDEENGWKWVRHPNDLGWIADDLRMYGINDEGKRADLNPAKHFGTAAVCALRDIGDTFHYGGGLHAKIPEGAELQALMARERGWAFIGDDWAGSYRNSGHTGSPVKGFVGLNRAYSSISGNAGRTIALDVQPGSRIDWDPAWRIASVEDEGGAVGYTVVRSLL